MPRTAPKEPRFTGLPKKGGNLIRNGFDFREKRNQTIGRPIPVDSRTIAMGRARCPIEGRATRWAEEGRRAERSGLHGPSLHRSTKQAPTRQKWIKGQMGEAKPRKVTHMPRRSSATSSVKGRKEEKRIK